MIIQKNTHKHNLIGMSECKKCGKCCQFDSGHLVEDDVKKISSHLRMTQENFTKKYLDESEKFNTKAFKPKLVKERTMPYGRCIFLKDNLCSIHSVKPLHCKIGSPCMQHGEAASVWFTINYFVNKDDPESIRQWATYLKTHPTIPGGTLKDLVPDGEKLKKILSYEILTEKDFEEYGKVKKKSQ